MKKLPIGYSYFEELILENYVYIDKTEYIYNLLNSGKYYFLSRPRRFGKSLLISTIEKIFEARQELFKGLYIYDKIEWRKYPVIKISFLNISYSTPEELKQSLYECVLNIAEKYGIIIETKIYKSAFVELIKKLSAQEKVVILIDEYDKPLIDYLENLEQCAKNREILKNFYATIKGCDEYIKFVFITGVSKFSQTSIFSDLNNLYDITLDERYNSICGYKEIDIKTHFSEYLTELAQDFNLSKDEILEDIKFWYDGYSWSGKEFVYNPFSVLNLLAFKNFENYWFKSGSPTFLLKLLRLKNYDLSRVEKVIVSSDVFDKYNVENISVLPLLFQTGYLTIKQIEKSTEGTRYTLDYPNYEVKKSLLEHLVSEYCDEPNGGKSILLNELRKDLKNKKFDEFISGLKSLFAGLVYETQIKSEDFYSSIMYMVLALCGIDAKFEVLTNRGRLDCVIEYQQIAYIIEFKVNVSVEVALNQIKEKKYYEKYLVQNKEIYLCGITFDTQTKNIADYKFELFLKGEEV